MRLQRLVLWLIVVAALLTAVAATALHVASRSESLLRWGIAQFSGRLPCELTVDGLQGSLIEPLTIRRVACVGEDYRVEAHEVALEWSPWLLRHRRLEVARVRMSLLRIESRQTDSETARPPDDLELPVVVRLGALEIEEMRIERGGDPLVLRELRAAYHGDARAHRLSLQRLSSEWGAVEGDATVGATRPFRLDARVLATSAYLEGWPLVADVSLSGDLEAFSADIQATAGALPLVAHIDVMPFDADPVRRVVARADGVDLAKIDARLPQTLLAVEVDAQARSLDRLSGRLRVENAQPGTIDRERLPLRVLQSAFTADAGGILLSEAVIDLAAAGRAAGTVGVEGGRMQLALDVRDLDLRGLHSTLRSTRLAGALGVAGDLERQRVTADLRERDLRLQGEALVEGARVQVDRLLALSGGARLEAAGEITLADTYPWTARGSLRDFDPARFGDFPQARINGSAELQGRLEPEWEARIRYALERSRFRGETLAGSGSLTVAPLRVRDADARLALGGNTIRVKGAFGRSGDAFEFRVEAPRLAALHAGVAGRVNAQGMVGGTPSRPALDVVLEAADLTYDGMRIGTAKAHAKVVQSDDPALEAAVRLARVSRGDLELDGLTVETSGTLSAHAIVVAASDQHLALDGRIEGGWDRARNLWLGTVSRLENGGDYAFRLTRPALLEVSADRVAVGATAVHFQQTDIAVEETRYEGGELTAAGSISGVRLARLLALLDIPPPIETTLMLRGRWALRIGETFDGVVEVVRDSGDIVIPAARPHALGLRETRLQVRAEANTVVARAEVKGEGLDAQMRAETRLERRGARWGIPGTAPLRVEANARLDSVQPLIALAAPAISADGRATLQVRGDGTIAQPQLQGTLAAERLKFEQVENGVFFRDGELRATFGETGIVLDRFSIRGGSGTFGASGRLAARGGPRLELEWHADKLTVVQHPDLRLTVTGSGTVQADDSRIALAGRLAADQGRIELRSGTAPALGEDVHVAGREDSVPISARVLRSALDLNLDLGPDFRISGRGIDARLAGSIALLTTEDATLAARGEITTARGGTFEAYGQKLAIDRGVLYFAGPVDNPGLEIVAMRKNQQVEAGVEVTGTARDPRVRLVSNPDVPDPEKLSWLVLGRRVEAGDTSDAQQLQASAVALAAGLGTAPLQQQLARAVGVDEISFTPAIDGSQGGVVTVGKRLSDRIYVSNERSLATATNTLRVSYQISQRWSLRTETGETDAVDLFFTIFFD